MNNKLILLLLIIYIIFYYTMVLIKNTELFMNNKYNLNYKDKYNIIEYTNDEDNEHINTNELINLNYKSNDYLFVTTLENIDNLDNIPSFILIIDFPYFGGGTTFFLNTILSKYQDTNFLIIRNFNSNISIYLNDKYILNTLFSDITALTLLHKNKFKIIKIFINSIIGHTRFFLDNILLLHDDITLITHDYSGLYNIWQPTNINTLYTEYTPITANININYINTIITQDINNLPVYDKYLGKGKDIIITPLPDYGTQDKKIITNNKNLIIGVLGNISSIKGKELIIELINLKLYTIYIFGDINLEYNKQFKYKDIYELNILLEKYKPNLWIEASIWPETYSYVLSLMMITDLPILYQKKEFISVIENRLENYKKAVPFKNLSSLIDDDILIKNKQNYFYTIAPLIYYNNFWNNYFGSIILNSTENKFDISTYAVYFPQFHEFIENNINYYQGFTDIKNLHLILTENENIQLDTPKIDNILDYDLVNNSKLITNQIKILTQYNINGFAIYYYWFSNNTITNKHMIMKDVIDIFFKININTRKVFFIWANENWVNNKSFGNTTNNISNIYNKDTINKNVENLLIYFKNNNYLKIDNKPVFLVHHPWFMTSEQLSLLENILDKQCKNNGFAGIYLIINTMMGGDYDNYLNYNFHFNYKHNFFYKNNQKYVDYEKYIDDIIYKPNVLQTLVFDFDNRTRLYKPNNLDNSTICINNTKENQLKLINQTITHYSTTTRKINKILLINAWNEWGERMAIEPSNEKGYYYLNLIKSNLLK